MELAHGLLLNEDALKTIPENKKETFIYEWLRFLLKVLKASHKVCFCLCYCKILGCLLCREVNFHCNRILLCKLGI